MPIQLPSVPVHFAANETSRTGFQPLEKVIAVDVGGSDPQKGSFKGNAFHPESTQNSFVVGSPSTRVFVQPEGIGNKQRFIEGVKDGIFDLHRATGEYDPMQAVVVFTPGQSPYGEPNKVKYLANIVNGKGKPFQNLNFGPLARGYANHGVKFIRANDMMGGETYIVRCLAASDQYKKWLATPGNAGMVMAVGGGLGVAEFRNLGDNNITLIATESGHLSWPDNRSLPKPRTVESDAASVSALVRNFICEYNLNPLPENQKLSLANMDWLNHAVMVTTFKEAKRITKKDLDETAYYKASAKAINDCLDGLAFEAQQGMLHGVQKVFLYGTVVSGIQKALEDNHLENYPDFAKLLSNAKQQMGTLLGDGYNQKSNLEKLLLIKTYHQLDAVGKELFQDNQFDINAQLDVPDNSLGGYFFAHNTPIGEGNNQYKLPLEVLTMRPKSQAALRFSALA